MWGCGEHMTRKQPPKQDQLGKRLQNASDDLDKIMKDLQRDCKPYWKFTDLVMELNDIAHQADVQTKDLARVMKAKDKAAKEIRALNEEVALGISRLAFCSEKKVKK